MPDNIKPDSLGIITPQQVLDWHGSDHSIEELAAILAGVLNGTYLIYTARQEILSYTT